MAVMTYRYWVWDTLSILKKTDASSDITEDQVVFWINTIANQVRKERIEKTPTGRYLNIFTNIQIQSSNTSTNPNLVKNRKYVDLPDAVYDMMNERGINYICHTQDGTCPPEFLNLYFQPTTPSKAQRLTYSPYETPSAKNPYFYLVDKRRVYLLGLETVSPRSLEMGLYTTLNLRTNTINLDDEVDLVEEHIDLVRRRILNLASFTMSIPRDSRNDGTDEVDLVKSKPITQPAGN